MARGMLDDFLVWAAGSSRWDHPAGDLGLVCGAVGLQTERETALQGRGVAFGHQFVLGSTALGLGALGGKQVTEAGSAAHELTFGGQLEALGDGLLGLLHGKGVRTQRTPGGVARANSGEFGFWTKTALTGGASTGLFSLPFFGFLAQW